MIEVQKKGRLVGLLFLLAALLLTGCARSEELATNGGFAAAPGAPADYDYAESEAYTGTTLAVLYQDSQVQERLIIRNAELAIVVADTTESMDSIESLVGAANGWVVNSNVWDYGGVKRGNMTVRIPAETLDSFLDEIHTLSLEVTSQNISGQDVTEEFVDLQAQLGNLQATADRVRNFLDEAKTVEEALQVNAELSRLEGEIERISGRIQYLESSARYSSVSIDITPDALNQPVTVGRWQPGGTVRDAIKALLKTLQWLVDVLIFLVLFVLPVLAIIAAPIVLFIVIVRRIRRRRARNKPAAG